MPHEMSSNGFLDLRVSLVANTYIEPQEKDVMKILNRMKEIVA